MRVPRRHRFRTRLSASELFARLPAAMRFRMARGEDGQQVFGAGPVDVVPDGSGRGVPKDELRRALPRVPDARREIFPGGAVGCLAYERGYDVEGLAAPRGRAPGPTAYFAVYDTFAVTHPESEEVEVVSWGLRDGAFDAKRALTRAEDLEEALRAEAAPTSTPPPAFAAAEVRGSLDAPAHERALAEILETIRRGDIYQANLTARFDVTTDLDAVTLFERLLADNPAPFSFFLETPHGTVISSSPERLLAARDRHVETRPIKGTMARHPDPAIDRRLAAELLASEKNRAELLMITDLLRNDLGKVCESGTVRVPKLVTVESFAHLHHLVSTIEGRLRQGLDVFDALEAVFPCGSITGAPKRRAMEILRDLEPVARGVYTGAVGWIGFDWSADLAVAIRTGTLADGVFSFGAGGGIVADSEAASEWSELLLKARAFSLALGVDLEQALCGRES